MPREDDKDKFQHFDDLYGKETMEVFRPSYVENLYETNKALLIREKAQDSTECVACLKPRVVFANKKEWKTHLNQITSHLEELYHICGNELFEEGHPLHEKIVTRRMLNCSDPMETQYYSSSVNFPNVCYFCGEIG